MLRNSVFRDNLFLCVKERPTKLYDELAGYIKDKNGLCGKIHCVVAHEKTKIHSELIKCGINEVKYHGQLSQDVKSANQKAWMEGQVNVIVPNASFGMGIDKPNVRWVVHARIPTSIDEYF